MTVWTAASDCGQLVTVYEQPVTVYEQLVTV